MVMAVLVGTVAYVWQVASFESAVVEIEACFSCMGLTLTGNGSLYQLYRRRKA